jgi:putative transposase
MSQRIAPSDRKAQELRALLEGQSEGQRGEEVLSTLGRLSTERVVQETLEPEPAQALGRGRYERREGELGSRNGYEAGTLKTAAGVLRVQVPQIRGWEEPYRSPLWSQVASTRDVLRRLIVERYAGGMAQRDIDYGLEKAVGQFVLAKSTVSELTDTLTQEYAAVRSRALRGYEVASLFIDAVYEPLRRWGSKTGVLCVWAICGEGRKVLLSLSTANRESQERCLEGLRDLLKRGLQTPVTITTAGAVGLPTALDAIWPKSLRIRWWFHKMQNLQQQVPPQAWPEFKALVADMRDAPSVAEAERRRQELVKRYQLDFPEACRCLRDDAQASLNPLSVPPRHQHYGRTSNLAERACEEERRRTKVIPQLWTEGGLVKLVLAVLIRVSERWGKKCCSEFEQRPVRSLRTQLKLDKQEVSFSDPKPEPQPRRSVASAA